MTKTYNHHFLVTGMTAILFLFSAYSEQIHAQSSAGPQPPPVTIELTSENTSPLPGDEIILHLKVTPQEDMHTDISCLLPEGVKPIMEPGLMLQPYRDWHLYNEQEPFLYEPLYREVVGLWVGPMTGGTTKEFVFRVIIPKAGSYQFTGIVKALAKWGIKEEILVINIE